MVSGPLGHRTQYATNGNKLPGLKRLTKTVERHCTLAPRLNSL